MRVTNSAAETRYVLSPDESRQFSDWVDEIQTVSEPVDRTDTFFVDDFVREDAFRYLSQDGRVSAITRRIPRGDVALTDVVIEAGEIFETNAAKGIYIATNQSEARDYDTSYEAQLMREGYIHPRYNGNLFLTFWLPNGGGGYRMSLLRSLHRTIDSRTGSDMIQYTIETNKNVIDAKIALDPEDIILGGVTPRPLRDTDLRTNGLSHHARYISEVLGISPPTFLAAEL